ncbi:MAG: 30S ribosomal protein S8 [Chloroflexi bacterium]|nr:MAG: 30S ribosomal protein S8 [Chloroflexota bacterium]
MSMSDPIADMLTRVRNALMREHPTVSMPISKAKEAIAQVLKDEGYIEDFKVVQEKPQSVLQIKLKYIGGRRDRRSVITGIERVSRPGRRVYVGKQDIPWVLSGMGIAIVTTSKGLMTGQQARQANVGGEVLCKVW